MRYSIEPRDMDKNISQNVSGKYGQKRFNIATRATKLAKKFGADVLKITLKRAIQKTAEATAYLICNKIADKVTKVSKNSPKTVKNEMENMEFDREIPKEIYTL